MLWARRKSRRHRRRGRRGGARGRRRSRGWGSSSRARGGLGCAEGPDLLVLPPAALLRGGGRGRGGADGHLVEADGRAGEEPDLPAVGAVVGGGKDLLPVHEAGDVLPGRLHAEGAGAAGLEGAVAGGQLLPPVLPEPLLPVPAAEEELPSGGEAEEGVVAAVPVAEHHALEVQDPGAAQGGEADLRGVIRPERVSGAEERIDVVLRPVFRVVPEEVEGVLPSISRTFHSSGPRLLTTDQPSDEGPGDVVVLGEALRGERPERPGREAREIRAVEGTSSFSPAAARSASAVRAFRVMGPPIRSPCLYR